jgi:putative tricarboxylic transport membrane protein
VNLQAFDLAILLVIGALGFMMRRFGLPVLPLVLGVILGPRLEKQLRQTLQLSAGDPAGLWSEPIAVVIYIIVAIILLWPLLLKLIRRNRPPGKPLLPANSGAADYSD